MHHQNTVLKFPTYDSYSISLLKWNANQEYWELLKACNSHRGYVRVLSENNLETGLSFCVLCFGPQRVYAFVTRQRLEWRASFINQSCLWRRRQIDIRAAASVARRHTHGRQVCWLISRRHTCMPRTRTTGRMTDCVTVRSMVSIARLTIWSILFSGRGWGTGRSFDSGAVHWRR